MKAWLLLLLIFVTASIQIVSCSSQNDDDFAEIDNDFDEFDFEEDTPNVKEKSADDKVLHTFMTFFCSSKTRAGRCRWNLLDFFLTRHDLYMYKYFKTLLKLVCPFQLTANDDADFDDDDEEFEEKPKNQAIFEQDLEDAVVEDVDSEFNHFADEEEFVNFNADDDHEDEFEHMSTKGRGAKGQYF